jgi:N-glycosylase/DNA lyase
VRHDLPVSGPLDLDLTFSCGQAFRWTRSGETWRGIVGRSDLEVAQAAPDRLAVTVRGFDPGPEALRRYFRLDQDPRVHLEHAEELRALPGILPLFGLRLLEQDPWETLASFIASAASNIRKISWCVEGMADRWGEPIPGSPHRAFPAPEAPAAAGARRLRATGLGFRAPYLARTARRLARGWDWEALRRSSYAEARSRLMELGGVGPKIADCTLLFGLGKLEAYPIDRWIRRATLELWARRRAKDSDLERWAERFGPGRGYLQQIIFHLRRTTGPLPPLERGKRSA